MNGGFCELLSAVSRYLGYYLTELLKESKELKNSAGATAGEKAEMEQAQKIYLDREVGVLKKAWSTLDLTTMTIKVDKENYDERSIVKRDFEAGMVAFLSVHQDLNAEERDEALEYLSGAVAFNNYFSGTVAFNQYLSMNSMYFLDRVVQREILKAFFNDEKNSLRVLIVTPEGQINAVTYVDYQKASPGTGTSAKIEKVGNLNLEKYLKKKNAELEFVKNGKHFVVETWKNSSEFAISLKEGNQKKSLHCEYPSRYVVCAVPQK